MWCGTHHVVKLMIVKYNNMCQIVVLAQRENFKGQKVDLSLWNFSEKCGCSE